MDRNWQRGGDPNRRGAYNNYNRAQRDGHDPSSSSRGWLPTTTTPLQLLTSYPELQPQGGYGRDFAPTAAPQPGQPGYQQFSDVVSVWRWRWPDQPHPDSGTVFAEPGSSSSVIPLPHAPVDLPGGSAGGYGYAQQPGSAAVFDAHGYNYNGNPPHGSAYEPGARVYAQPRAGADFFAWRGDANNDPYTSAGLIAPPADASQGASRGLVPHDPNRSRLALLNSRASDLQRALQRASTPGAIEAIVNTVLLDQQNGIPLMGIAQHRPGERAVMDLVRLASQHLEPRALQQLFRCLVQGWIMEQSNGHELLRHFFTTYGYVRCSIFIDELAHPRFWAMVTSNYGARSMMACLDYAAYTAQGPALYDRVVNHTVEIAGNMNGSMLLRNIFQNGHNDQLQERIRRRVEAHLVELSLGQFGSNVVQACFIPSRTMTGPLVPLLQRGLRAFCGLPWEHLRELVQDPRASYMLYRLLRTSEYNRVARAETTRLARQIWEVVPVEDEDLDNIIRQILHLRPSTRSRRR